MSINDHKWKLVNSVQFHDSRLIQLHLNEEDVKALERNATWPLHAKLSGFQGSNG